MALTEGRVTKSERWWDCRSGMRLRCQLAKCNKIYGKSSKVIDLGGTAGDRARNTTTKSGIATVISAIVVPAPMQCGNFITSVLFKCDCK